MSQLIFRQGQKILFQGDSITDCGRQEHPYQNIGYGYFLFCFAMTQARYPELDLHFTNRGISGNTVWDLSERWETDAVAEHPDWMSCLIGINDATRAWDHRPGFDRHTPDKYITDYRRLLQEMADKTPAKFILWEPFLITTDKSLSRYNHLKPYIEAVHTLADEFDAVLIATQTLFDDAVEKRSPEFWAHDGVHPSKPGHALMAQAFLEAVGY